MGREIDSEHFNVTLWYAPLHNLSAYNLLGRVQSTSVRDGVNALIRGGTRCLRRLGSYS